MSVSAWFSGLPKEKRNIYAVLLGIILTTIPCYCLGIIALVTAPRSQLPTAPLVTLTPSPMRFSTSQFTPLPAESRGATATPRQLTTTPTQTLEPTPTQSFPTTAPTETIIPATDTPTSTPTSTTPPQTPTDTPTGTLTPSSTPTPTPTLDATVTAAANATATAIANATATAIANATATAIANATATAEAANDPPIATDDSASTPQDTAVTINVGANDSDPDGNLDPASVTVVSAPASGSTAIAGPGQISYTPAAGFSGSDTFTYEICDTDNACATASVNLTINP